MSNTTIATNENPLTKTIAYYAAFVALGLGSASLGPTLSFLADNTGSTISQISFLFFASSLGYLIGSFLGGRLYDRLPGHYIMGVTLVCIALGLSLIPTLSLLWVLTTVILLVSLVKGALDVGGNALLVWIHGSGVGPYMNGLHFFFGVGAFLSPLIIGQALSWSNNDVRWAYWALVIIVLPIAVPFFIIPSPKSNQVEHDEGKPKQINYRVLGLIVFIFFLYVGAEIGFGGWIATYAVELELTDAVNAAYLTSAFWGSLTLGRLLAIPMAARLRPRSIQFLNFAVCIISAGLILLAPASLTMLWIGTLGLGLGQASIFPTLISFAERRLPMTGQITSYFFIGASLGGMTWPFLIGQFFEYLGPQVMVLTILGVLIVALITFTILIIYSPSATRSD
jgi:FHS family Na+ dependent glucose MFS transporter 1